MEDKLVEILTRLQGAVEKGFDFASDQIPDVIHQLLLWHSIHSLMFFISGVVILGVIIYSLKVYKDKVYKDVVDLDDGVIGVFFMQLIFFILSIAMIVHNLAWLKIWIAPKVWLLEYIATLSK